jgi:hypothetical protein
MKLMQCRQVVKVEDPPFTGKAVHVEEARA